MESMTKRSRYNDDKHSSPPTTTSQNTGSDAHQNPNMKESEWGKVMVPKSRSEKSNQSSSITSGESTESASPENSTDSNNNSDDGLSIEPSRTGSNADLLTLSSRVPIPAFIKFVEGESFVLPPLSQLQSTKESNLQESPFALEILGMDDKLIALQNVLQQSGVEIADNSPAAVLAATYDYIMQLRSSSKRFESNLKDLQAALDKHDDVVCQAILKNVQMDALRNERITANSSTIIASGTVDKDLNFIDASEELMEILHPGQSSDSSNDNLSMLPDKEWNATEFNLLHLVEGEYRDNLRTKLAALSSRSHDPLVSVSSAATSSDNDNNSSSDSESGNGRSSPTANPLYIYVTSNILTPNHGLGKRKRPCVLRITALISTSSQDSEGQDASSSPSSTSTSTKTPSYSVTIYST